MIVIKNVNLKLSQTGIRIQFCINEEIQNFTSGRGRNFVTHPKIIICLTRCAELGIIVIGNKLFYGHRIVPIYYGIGPVIVCIHKISRNGFFGQLQVDCAAVGNNDGLKKWQKIPVRNFDGISSFP